MAYSRATVFEACTFLGRYFENHGELDDILLRWELDGFVPELHGTIADRFRRFFILIRDNPVIQYDGRYVRELVVEEAALYAPTPFQPVPGFVQADRFLRALSRDGYTINENHETRPNLPLLADLPAAKDEIHSLLTKHHLGTPQGHLKQAINCHADGNWAAANGQLRTFCESLLDEIAVLVVPPDAGGKAPGEARRQLLANLPVPFLSRELGEWSDDGKNFVNGLFKRLHPQGNHPGLSDEDDCTFRLYLVLVVGRLFLRRMDERI
jgi:hypothetical protein